MPDRVEEPDDAPNSNPAMERADELLDVAGERMGRWAADMSLRMRRAAALARETAEDMLAEAQAIRRRKS